VYMRVFYTHYVTPTIQTLSCGLNAGYIWGDGYYSLWNPCGHAAGSVLIK